MKNYSPQPGQVTAFDGAKPFKISCGSYHNVCLSYRLPKVEESGASEEINAAAQQQVLGHRNQNAAANNAAAAGGHQDESCPYVEQI